MPRLIVCAPIATAFVVGCLTQPHPFSGNGSGSGDGGSGSGGSTTRCDSPMTIDMFTSPPSGAIPCFGTASTTDTASGGKFTETGSNTDDIYCEWTVDNLGAGLVVQVTSVTSSGGSGATATFGASPEGSSTMSIGLQVPTNTGQLELLGNGVMMGMVPNAPLWLLIAAPAPQTVRFAYANNFDPDLTKWQTLHTYGVGSSTTTLQAGVRLDLAVGVTAGAGSASFMHFQRCP